MQADRAPARATGGVSREGDFGPIAPLRYGFDDGRIRHVELADAAQRVAHDGALGGELTIVAEVLQLAVAAMVLGVVGARRRHAGCARRPALRQLAPRELLVNLHPRPHPPPPPPPAPPPT